MMTGTLKRIRAHARQVSSVAVWAQAHKVIFLLLNTYFGAHKYIHLLHSIMHEYGQFHLTVYEYSHDPVPHMTQICDEWHNYEYRLGHKGDQQLAALPIQ